MKIFKSHFWYNKRQRNGIFFLIGLICILQAIYVFVDFSSKEIIETDSSELIIFQHKIDSLKKVEIERRKPKIYPFNPNFITDYKGAKLGMSIEEIDRLHKYRARQKFVNSVKEFQQITKVSDSLLNKISPYFKFPAWVIKRNKALKRKKASLSNKKEGREIDFEEADETPVINKINVNTASFKQILAIPNIDYKLCKAILEYRDEVAELQDIAELRNIKDFPLDKYDRIVLYLKAE